MPQPANRQSGCKGYLLETVELLCQREQKEVSQ
jgi:hypothetical protein